MKRLLSVLALLVVMAACSYTEKAPLVARTRRADSAIYATMLDSLRPGHESARVVRQYGELPDSTPDIAKVAGWVAGQRDHLDSALVVKLSRQRQEGSVVATVGNLAGIRWIDRDSVMAETLGAPETTRVVQLSRIAYSADSTSAMVYASMSCGGLCGNGSFYQFRYSLEHGWLLVGTVLRFIS